MIFRTMILQYLECSKETSSSWQYSNVDCDPDTNLDVAFIGMFYLLKPEHGI